MLKKIFIVIFFLFLAVQFVTSEVIFRVLEDTPVWQSKGNLDPRKDSTIAKIIPKNSIISNITPPSLGYINGINTFIHSGVIVENAKYQIAANTFASIDTKELFKESFLTKADSDI